MKNSHVRPFCIMLFVCIFALTPILGLTPSVEASQTDEENEVQEIAEPSFEGLLQRIEQLETEGAFKNRGASQSLKAQLQTVIRFEQREDSEQTQHHFENFLSTLDQRLAQGSISNEGYERLDAYIDTMVNPVPPEEEITIVSQGQAQAVIIVTEDADDPVNKAADSLAEYVEKSTGARLPILTASDIAGNETDYEGHTRIYVGNQAPGTDTFIEEQLTDLDDHGFLIYPHEDTITIIGPSVWGTLNGANEFLERFVGVRWLMYGPDGEDVPELTDLTVPVADVREEPAFTYRVVTSLRLDPEAPGDYQWMSEFGQRNKLQGNYNVPIEFNHNIYTLFPVEKYGETNPEFYPGGNPPAPGDYHRWQPCFSLPETIDVAVEGILEYFANNPNAKSFSLGVNDIGGYCEQRPSHPAYPGKTNSQGYVDMSDIYYAWVNEVVEQVLEVYPDKWFGLLAYREVVDPPSFPLNPRVVPFRTKDRMAWIDDEIRTDDLQRVDDWNEKIGQMAWYDYMYGTFYAVPRVYPHLTADMLRTAEEKGVYGHFLEMNHNAGDAPKGWITAKLLWDPDQDVDALLQEWYERTVGTEAAPYLAAVYELWEDFWMERIKDTHWFESSKGSTYLNFEEQSYLHAVTDEDMAESMRLLDLVVDKAETPQQLKRAQMIQRMFEYYEASVLSYPREIPAPTNEAEAIEFLENLKIDERVRLVNKREDDRAEFRSDPNMRLATGRWYVWSGWNGYEFWHLVHYLKEHEPAGGAVTNQLRVMAATSESHNLRNFAEFVLRVHDQETTSLTLNSSFEEGSGTSATSWNFWNPNGSAEKIERVEGIAHSGNSSVMIENVKVRAGTHQTFDVKPGLTAANVHYYTSADTETDGGVRIVMSLLDANGNTLRDFVSETVSLSDTAGEWASIGLLENIPATVNGAEVKRILVNAQVYRAPDAQVYLDDVTVFQNELKDHAHPDRDRKMFTSNSSFEEGSKTSPPWYYNIAGSTGTIERVEGIARTGIASVLVDQMEQGGPALGFEIQPGLTATQLHYYTPSDTTGGTIQLRLNLRDGNGTLLTTLQTPAENLSTNAGEWSSLEFVEDIPEMINGKEVVRAQAVALIRNAQDAQVYIDDFVVYQGVLSSVGLQSLVELFEEAGAFENAQDAHDLIDHLTTVSHLEENELADEVIEQMEDFILSLQDLKEEGLISERAFYILEADALVLIAKWRN